MTTPDHEKWMNRFDSEEAPRKLEIEIENRRNSLLEEIYKKHPVPNSFLWQKAVALGAQPDYSEADEGMEKERV